MVEGRGLVLRGVLWCPGTFGPSCTQVLVLGEDLLSVVPGVETLAQNFSKLSRGKKHHNGGVKGERSLRAWLLERAGSACLGRDKCLQVAAQAWPREDESVLCFFCRLKFDRNLPYAFRQGVFLFSLYDFFNFFFFFCKANLFLPMENTAFWLNSVVFDLE